MPSLLSLVDVHQFYGIEIGEFPVRIAETALWMMDHIMNNRLSLEFGETYARIPLKSSPSIVHGDALETNWADRATARVTVPSFSAIRHSAGRSSNPQSNETKFGASPVSGAVGARSTT